MTDVHQKYAQDNIAAVEAGSKQAAGGATRGTSITMGGINSAAALEVRGNRAILEGSSTAAAQVRDAALVAARLHMSSAIVHQLSRAAARAMEGLALRY
jgi:hypothetical protein